MEIAKHQLHQFRYRLYQRSQGEPRPDFALRVMTNSPSKTLRSATSAGTYIAALAAPNGTAAYVGASLALVDGTESSIHQRQRAGSVEQRTKN